MSCTTDVCGNGNGNHPQPGDPDTNVILSARTIYTGIEVTWSWPVTNGHAVAFTHVFRSNSSDFTTAIEIAKAGGSFYVDRLNPATPTTYYYWIKIVSVNGTEGVLVGPVSAEAKPLASQTLESLTGLIDNGVLAQDLKTDIAGITLNNQAILDEIKNRLLADQGFAASYADVQSGLTQAMTYINTEITQRQDGDSALVNQINILAAANKDALAAIDTETQVRVTQTTALTSQVTSLISTVGNSSAGLVHDVNTLATTTSAQTKDITTLVSTVGDVNSGLVHDTQTNATNTAALAHDLTTVEASLNGNIATGQVGLITVVGDQANTLTKIKAEYFAKLEVNGLIGGFGILNDGIDVEAGFDVDRFWIGRTSDTKVKPFIVSDGIVYMDAARIRDADITSLKLAGEAVTVPIVASVPDKQRRGQGQGAFSIINEGWINLSQDGMIYVLVTAGQHFPQKDDYWTFQIRVDGVTLRDVGGMKANDAVALSITTGLTAGTHHIEVAWAGGTTALLGYCDLFMMGVKK